MGKNIQGAMGICLVSEGVQCLEGRGECARKYFPPTVIFELPFKYEFWLTKVKKQATSG